LIGTELKELMNTRMPVTIVSDELLAKLYSAALQKLGISGITYQDAGKAILNGHCKICDLYMSKLYSKQVFNKQ